MKLNSHKGPFKKLTLPTAVPEPNHNQWRQIKQILIHDLFLTDRQIRCLDTLIPDVNYDA
jgi:hypothetical protein